MENKFSLELKNILEKKTVKCAEDLGLSQENTKVIIFTIIKYRSRILEEAFIYLNINANDILSEIISIEHSQMPVVDPKINKIQSNYHEIHNNGIFISAEKESRNMGHSEICSEHVVLAFLKYRGDNGLINSIKNILLKYGIKTNEYSKFLTWASSEDDVAEPKDSKKKTNQKQAKRQTSQENSEEKMDPQMRLHKMEQGLSIAGHIRNINNYVASNSEIFVGRDTEIERAIRILCRKQKRNLMIIGPAGTGKTSLVKGIVSKIINNKVPNIISGKSCYQIFLDNIVSGTKFRGEFEKKIKEVIDFVSLKNEVSGSMPIIFIDEIHTLVGAGAAEGAIDASGILKPRLSSGEIQCIGTTTLEEYRKYILPDTALSRRFTNIFLDEPSEKETEEIMMGIRSEYEEFHGISISEEIIKKIVSMSGKYIKNRFFPDKAIDVLDESCSKAVFCFQNREKKSEEDEKPKVSLEIIADIMSDFTRVPMSIMIDDEREKLSSLDEEINKIVIGQQNAVNKAVQSIHSSRAGFSDPDKPISTFLFLGSSGCGKTLLAKTISEKMFGTDKIIRLDMSEYSDKINISRMIGSPPGYVGYDEAGQLTEAVKNKPYSVVLLDEIEKAHPSVFNLFLQVFDEGRLTDAAGRHVDFRNTIIIMTSNIGISGIKSSGKRIGFSVPSELDKQSEIETYLTVKVKDFFPPEFVNRIDEIIVFNRISKENMPLILENEIGKTKERMKDKGYRIVLMASAKEHLIEMGFDEEYGARPLRRLIKNAIEQPLATMVVNGGLREGDTVFISKLEGNASMSFKIKNKRT